MNCNDVEEGQVIERHLAGKLSPEESEAFERHYFDCDRCFSELQFRRGVGMELAGKEMRASHRDLPIPPRFWSRRSRAWRPLATAALLVLLILPVYLLIRRGSEPLVNTEILRQLARVEEVPPYLPTTVRGANQQAEEQFRRGMEQYLTGDYGQAIPLLEDATQLDSDHVPAFFYLGICYLISGDPAGALKPLNRTISLGGAYEKEEARWYLAKAHFALGQVGEGRDELERILELKGRFFEDAQKNLEQIHSMKRDD